MNHTKFPSANGNKMTGTSVEEAGASYNANANFMANGNVSAFNANQTFVNPNHQSTTSTFAPNNDMTNNNDMQRKSKRRPSEQKIVTGRSFKRLRLDHVHIAGSSLAAGASGGGVNIGISSTQSFGTLSVGTMGGDLESNDEYLEEDDDETLGDGGTATAGADGGGESVASSWVASLGSNTNFRKRRIAIPSKFQQSHAAASQFQSDEDVDDAATCSAMTTAAIWLFLLPFPNG